MAEPGADAATAAPRPLRQEQEDADDAFVPVGPGVGRIQLPIAFTGLGHVNMYVLEDGDGFAVVDPGLPGRSAWDELTTRLANAGIPVERIHTVVVTHSHPDHFGGAGLLAERAGARVVASDRFRTWWDPDDLDDRELEDAASPSVPGATTSAAPFADALTDETDGERLPPSPFGRPTPWGGRTEDLPPERKAELAANREEAARWFRVPRPALRLADDDPIMLAGREWFALFTPGHTADHLCLFDPTHGLLLAGDHVLPTITPHISGMIQGDPLARYVESLERIAAMDGVGTVLPAHGQPFSDLTGRVAQIIDHHDRRLSELAVISEGLGWATVQEISHHLFAERSWGSMAESETYAHLEHLRLQGLAGRREVGGLLEYLAEP